MLITNFESYIINYADDAEILIFGNDTEAINYCKMRAEEEPDMHVSLFPERDGGLDGKAIWSNE